MPVTPRLPSDRPSRSRALFTLEAQRLLSAGHFREAAEICKRGLVYFPENHMGYMILAQAYHMLGEDDRAVNVIGDGCRRTDSERLRTLYATLTGRARTASTAAHPAEPAAHASMDATVATEPTVAEPAASEPVIAEPVAEPVVDEPTIAEPVVDEPVIAEPAIAEPVVDEPVIDESVVAEPAVAEPIIDELAVAEPVVSEPVIAEPAIAEPVVAEPAAAPSPIPHAPVSVEIPEAEAVHAAVEIENDDSEAIDTAPPSEPEAIAEQPAAEAEPVADAEPVAEADPIDAISHEEAPPFIEEQPTIDTLATGNEIADEPAPAAAANDDSAHAEEDESEVALAAAESQPELESEEWSWRPEEEFFVAVESDQRESISAQEAPARTVPAQEIFVSHSDIVSAHPSTPAEVPAAEHSEPGPAGLRMFGSLAAQSQHGARAEQPDRARPLALALHAGKSISRLRSSNLRLIPGLEFAPLRHEDNMRRQSIAPLISEPMPQPEVRSRAAKKAIEETALPPLPSLGDSPGTEGTPPQMRIQTTEPARTIEPAPLAMQSPQQPAPRTAQPPPTATQAPKSADLTPLEELARRLENARIPVVEEPEQRTAYEPSIVSDTLANILVAQGAFAEALKAFQTLARIKPERFEYYQGRIQEMKWRMQNPGE